MGIKLLLIIAIGLTAAGCFKNPGDQNMPTFTTALPVAPVYDYSSIMDSYLRANGACNGNTSIEFTWSSDLASQQTKEVQCSGDKIDAHLPVLFGDKIQTYKVTMVAKLRNNTSAPLTVTVAYNPPPPLTPGFAVLPGGGLSTDGSTVQIFSAIGEVLDPATVTGTGVTVRTGVQGINDQPIP